MRYKREHERRAGSERRNVIGFDAAVVGAGRTEFGADGSPVPPAGTGDARVLAAWLATGGEDRAWLARVALADCEAGGSFEPGVVLPWAWPTEAVRDALDVLYDPAGPWKWEAGPDPVRPKGPPKFMFRVSEATLGEHSFRVRALNAVEALAWFFKTSEERIREWMAGVGAPRYCKSEHWGESWPRCDVDQWGNVLEEDCGCEPMEISVYDGAFPVDDDHLEVGMDGAAEFWGKVYLEDDEVTVPEGMASVLDLKGSEEVAVEPAHEQFWQVGDYEYAPPDPKRE